MNFDLKIKGLIRVIQMESIVCTTIALLMKQRVPENVECIISTFLAEDPDEIRSRDLYKLMCASIYGKTLKGKKIKFDRYCKNLRYDAFFVYSYDTAVIQINLKDRTAKRLGKWSKTTSTHMNYAIRMFAMFYQFTEIK